jgi:hypothetical protein
MKYESLILCIQRKILFKYRISYDKIKMLIEFLKSPVYEEGC